MIKKQTLFTILFITAFTLSIVLPVLSITMNEKKVRDIRALDNALLPGQRIVLDSPDSCESHPTWNSNTEITLKENERGNAWIQINALNANCNTFNLEEVNSIQVEDTSTGTVIKSIYW